MKRVTRYVLGELLKVFLITLTGMTLLMLIAGVAHEAIRQGLGLEPIVKLIPYALPNALRFAVPGTILFATCSVYGRMSASNEITAIKSLGISPIATITPVLILAFFVSLGGVWLNDLAVSWGRKGMQRVILHSVEKIAYGLLRTQRSYSNAQFSINVKRVDDRRLILPTIYIHTSEDSPPTFVSAQEAELQLDSETEVLSITLTNGLISVGDQTEMRFPDTIKHEIPLTLATLNGDDRESPSSCPLWRIGPEIEKQKADMQALKERFAAEAALQMMTGEMDALTDDDWKRRNRQLDDAVFRLHRLQTEPWRRWATGFSCLFFVMVGAPLAIRMRNADLWSSFAMCFLPILVVYYPLLALGVDCAKSGDLPPCSVWVGNVIFGLVGFWLLRRTLRN
jgi:lipopolysaccharide export system permease protein